MSRVTRKQKICKSDKIILGSDLRHENTKYFEYSHYLGKKKSALCRWPNTQSKIHSSKQTAAMQISYPFTNTKT